MVASTVNCQCSIPQTLPSALCTTLWLELATWLGLMASLFLLFIIRASAWEPPPLDTSPETWSKQVCPLYPLLEADAETQEASKLWVNLEASEDQVWSGGRDYVLYIVISEMFSKKFFFLVEMQTQLGGRSLWLWCSGKSACLVFRNGSLLWAERPFWCLGWADWQFWIVDDILKGDRPLCAKEPA